MKIEFEWSYDSFILGLMNTKGEDEDGEFNLFSIGFLIFTIDFYKYGSSKEN